MTVMGSGSRPTQPGFVWLSTTQITVGRASYGKIARKSSARIAVRHRRRHTKSLNPV